ncbi:MAG: SGNH/GDSL hydrolase family protein [Kiritimatiellae bacterium]|nr:SGNH/GDSL hydrolase family protein [Kiritimatiellia bacterium]
MKPIKYLVILVLSAVVFFGCGGGGSGNNPLPPEESTLVLDDSVYIALGDGITSGFGSSSISWTEKLSIRNVNIINLAVSGTHSDYGSNNIEAFMQEYKPRLVMVLYGVNDVAAGTSTATIIGNLESIIQVVQYHGGNIIFGTIPVVSQYSVLEANTARKLNTDIQTLCENYGIQCADVGSQVGYFSGWYLEDGLHPTLEAPKLIAEAFRSKTGK